MVGLAGDDIIIEGAGNDLVVGGAVSYAATTMLLPTRLSRQSDMCCVTRD